MASHLSLAPPIAVDLTEDLDLTDEEGLLARDYVEYHPAGVRNLLAALNLKAPDAPADESERVVIDMAIYRATGNAHLATIFSAAG